MSEELKTRDIIEMLEQTGHKLIVDWLYTDDDCYFAAYGKSKARNSNDIARKIIQAVYRLTVADKKVRKLKEENDELRRLLAFTVPEIECKTQAQSKLISHIGEVLKAGPIPK